MLIKYTVVNSELHYLPLHAKERLEAKKTHNAFHNPFVIGGALIVPPLGNQPITAQATVFSLLCCCEARERL